MRKAEPEIVRPQSPFMFPRAHQLEAINRFKKKEVMGLFFEMGCGKSYTLLKIAEEKWKAREIDGLLGF